MSILNLIIYINIRVSLPKNYLIYGVPWLRQESDTDNFVGFLITSRNAVSPKRNKNKATNWTTVSWQWISCLAGKKKTSSYCVEWHKAVLGLRLVVTLSIRTHITFTPPRDMARVRVWECFSMWQLCHIYLQQQAIVKCNLFKVIKILKPQRVR